MNELLEVKTLGTIQRHVNDAIENTNIYLKRMGDFFIIEEKDWGLLKLAFHKLEVTHQIQKDDPTTDDFLKFFLVLYSHTSEREGSSIERDSQIIYIGDELTEVPDDGVDYKLKFSVKYLCDHKDTPVILAW